MMMMISFPSLPFPAVSVANFRTGCTLHCLRWLHSFSNLDRSTFVRQDRSSPVKKNAQILLVVVDVVILLHRAPCGTVGVERMFYSVIVL